MGFQKVEYTFPDEEKDEVIEVEDSSAVEIDLSGKSEPVEEKPVKQEEEAEVEVEVVDDVPKADRGRKASKPPEDLTEEELEDYSDKVRKRIQHFSKVITTNDVPKKRRIVNVWSLKTTQKRLLKRTTS